MLARLLLIADRLFGSRVRVSVFEPLVADWQRELVATSGAPRIAVAIRGSLALVVCIVACALTEGIAMGIAIKGTAVLVISTVMLLLLQMALNSLQFALSFPLEWRLWIALSMILPTVVPMALLPVMMLLRGRRLTSLRHAVLSIAAGAALAYIVTALAPLTRADVRDALYQERHRLAIANDLAGRYQYPGTVLRRLRPTTPEQRAAFRRDPRYQQYQKELTRPQWGRPALLSAGLSVSLGLLGWALGGFRRARMAPIAAWWTIAWVSLLVMGGRFSYWVNGAGVRVGGGPEWLPHAAFFIAAVVLLIFETRRRSTEAPTPSGSFPTAPAGAASHQ